MLFLSCLASYQNNLFQVFKLTETFGGFKAKPNAVGVFESRSSKSGKLRVSLAQLPDSPARLNVGSYTVNLDVLVEYVEDRKSTRLNSSHLGISYAVFCLKKKKTQKLLH